MKRCPECRRDYYDDSLLYCLEDGAALIQGAVPSPDEPQTAILYETSAPKEAATRSQIHSTESTESFPSAQPLTSNGFDKRIVFIPAALLMIVLGGVFGYRYLSATRQIESIAIMPFVNESGNADVEYLSDGMTETLIKSLSGLPGLDVKPRSAVFRYKGKDADVTTVGKELNVQAILNGRVVQHGDQLDLSLELVDVKKNSVIWTEQYQRKQSDLISLQSEIAKDVSTKLRAKLSGAEETKVTQAGTADPDAYQAYLKGRYFWNRRTAENFKKAIEQFKIAADRDPGYALALVGLADCYAVSSEYVGTPSSETKPKARAYAERALAIDPSLAEAHATIAAIDDFDWQWADSEKEFKRAIELNPNYATTYHWYSIFLRNVGRLEESSAAIKRASELDPLSAVISVNVSRVYQVQNQHDASIANSLKILEIDPNFGVTYEYLALSYLAKGKVDDAIANAEKAVAMTNRSGIALGDLGYVYASTGRRTDALTIVSELKEKYARHEAIGHDLAAVWSALGDHDKAFDWLDKDFQARDGRLSNITWEPEFDSIRRDERYRKLMKQMNLPEQTL